MKHRLKKWVKRIGVAAGILVSAVGVLLAYSYFVEPRSFVITEETLTVPHWSSKLNGFKVVAISDIHAGSNFAPAERLRFVVEQANAQDPDIIVLLGDYVSETGRVENFRSRPPGTDGTYLRMSPEEITAAISGFRARYGVFAIIGNHDEYFNTPKIKAALENAGITVLENETKQISFENGEIVTIWGIEDLWKRRRVPTEAFDELPVKQNVIALTHNPDSVMEAPAGFSVMFAGHTHGGQLNWPIYGPLAVVNDKRFMRGHAVFEGKDVFVTTGVGTSVIPLRFRVPPEIAVVTLNSSGQ